MATNEEPHDTARALISELDRRLAGWPGPMPEVEDRIDTLAARLWLLSVPEEARTRPMALGGPEVFNTAWRDAVPPERLVYATARRRIGEALRPDEWGLPGGPDADALSAVRDELAEVVGDGAGAAESPGGGAGGEASRPEVDRLWFTLADVASLDNRGVSTVRGWIQSHPQFDRTAHQRKRRGQRADEYRGDIIALALEGRVSRIDGGNLAVKFRTECESRRSFCRE